MSQSCVYVWVTLGDWQQHFVNYIKFQEAEALGPYKKTGYLADRIAAKVNQQSIEL